MNLGMFMMPLHDPRRDLTTVLQEDRDAVILADSLGFSEAWCGEHVTSTAEPIPSSLMFFASLIDRAPNIRFASGVLNLPQMHPASVAAQVAQFDHLCGGRYLMGVGPGGLASDAEIFGLADRDERNRMFEESLSTIQALWQGGPGYRIDGEHWPVELEKAVMPELGVGQVIRPLQRPHPPICLSVVTPRSSTARMAGERGWYPVSASFIQARYIASHWEAYAEGCAAAKRPANPADWRIARSVLVTDDEARAEDYLADPEGALRFYFRYFITTYRQRGVLELLKPDVAMPDEAVTEEVVARSMVSYGSPATVLDKLVALSEEWGPYGTLLMVGHDWDDRPLWTRSMELLAREVMPKLSQHASTLKAAE